MRALIEAVPYKIHTVLTGNGTYFTTPGNEGSIAPLDQTRLRKERNLPRSCPRVGLCSETISMTGSQSRSILGPMVKLRHERTLKEATVRRYPYDSHGQLREHLAAFLAVYNFCEKTKDPSRANAPHIHLQMLDRNSGSVHP